MKSFPCDLAIMSAVETDVYELGTLFLCFLVLTVPPGEYRVVSNEYRSRYLLINQDLLPVALFSNRKIWIEGATKLNNI